MSARSAAVRWAEGRERVLFERLMNPLQETAPPKEVPTLQEFAPRFLDGHARANRQKPSGIAAKETFVRVHLTPLLGHKTLDAIKSEDVQRPAADPADGAVPRPSGVETGELIEGWRTHILRHTFCSHLAMRGAPARAIQERLAIGNWA